MVHRIRAPISVRGLELVKQHERFARISLLCQPSNAIVFNHLGGVPCGFHQRVHAIHTKLRVEIRALTSPVDQHLGVVKSLRRRAQVPLSNHGSLVAILLKHLWKGEQFPVEIASIHIFVKAIHVAELTCQNRRSAGSTNAVGAVHLVHSCPVLGNPVDVWGGGKF